MGKLDKMIHRITVGREYDYLANGLLHSDLPFRASVRPGSSILITSIRNEGSIIAEWVAHHKLLGFDEIVIYTNNNSDGSDDLLQCLADMGELTLVFNDVAEGVSPQWKAFRHSLFVSELAKSYEWCMFLDADEFLIPLVDGEVSSIENFVGVINSKFDADAIVFNWRWFSGYGDFKKSAGLLFDRFRHAGWEPHVKTLFRIEGISDVGIHAPIFRPSTKAVNADGQVRVRPGASQEPVCGSLGFVNHYWNRSFEEFFLKRMRGRGAKNPTPREWSTFFKWGVGGAEYEVQPKETHVARVRDKLNLYRKSIEFLAAEEKIETHTRAALESEAVRMTYESELQNIKTR